MDQRRSDYLLVKGIFLGEPGVGKTSIETRRTSRGALMEPIPCGIGVAFSTEMYFDGKLKLQLWDTAGQERYRSITRSYYRGANVAFVVFDVTDDAAHSAAKVVQWIRELISHHSHTPQSQHSAARLTDCLTIAVLGNKIDLTPLSKDHLHICAPMAAVQNAIEEQLSEELEAASCSVTYHLCSAKTNEGISEIFETKMAELYSGRKVLASDRVGGVKLPAAGPIPRRGNDWMNCGTC